MEQLSYRQFGFFLTEIKSKLAHDRKDFLKLTFRALGPHQGECKHSF